MNPRVSSDGLLKAMFNFLTAAFLHSEKRMIDVESFCCSYNYDYALQIDMNDGKGFQTCWRLPGDDLEGAISEAKKRRLKRKHRQRIIRRDFFTTVIDPKKISQKG